MIKPVRHSHPAPVAAPRDTEGSARHGVASNRAGPIPRRPPSTVIEGVSAAWIKAVCVDVNHGHVRGRRRQCGANQRRPGQAERQDGGNYESSPDAHGFLHKRLPGRPPVSLESPGVCGLVEWGYSRYGVRLFALNDNKKFVIKGKWQVTWQVTCHRSLQPLLRASGYRKVGAYLRGKIWRNLRNVLIIPRIKGLAIGRR